ncbi:cytochrome P450 [Dietzia sp. NCCP-2495]|uniref:cytochrome P450 n=1 Tax=Dietzia sp. NCCP-2495 TaxID=2934675 RepID=UPI0022318A79|nr:cytochrome P450 [Dietzia sp. NCCP-2495]GLB63880.1 cytochrome P450 [Dietzia sp. NCCP-2495]
MGKALPDPDAVVADQPKCPFVDMWSDEYNENNLEILKHLREEHDLAFHKQGNTTVPLVTRYKDMWKIQRDWRTFQSGRAASHLADRRYDDPNDTPTFIPLDTDPPVHSEWRQIIEPLMTLKKMEAHSEMIDGIADDLLSGLSGRTRFKVMSEFVRPLQARAIFAAILGVPADSDRIIQFSEWAQDALIVPERAVEAFGKLSGALMEILQERRANPRGDDDVVTVLANCRPGGEVPEDGDLIKIMIALTLGGLESTGTVLSGTIHHMATHPDDLKELQGDMSLLDEAIEEALRLFVNVTLTQRTVTKETTLNGYDLKPGDKIWNLPGSANRDETVFPNGDAWDVHRENKRHVSFGAGIHRCLGSNLARIFLRVAFTAVLTRMPGIALVQGQTIKTHSMPTRGLTEFEVTVDEISPAAAAG